MSTEYYSLKYSKKEELFKKFKNEEKQAEMPKILWWFSGYELKFKRALSFDPGIVLIVFLF